MKKPALFLDRDGVINVEKNYVHRKEDFDFIDGIFELVTAANKKNYWVVVVTNQAGIGRGYYTEADFHALMEWVREQFIAQGARIDAVYFCPDHPVHGIGKYHKENDCRKPGSGMFFQAAADLNIDLVASVMVGDKKSDMDAARGAGIKNLFCLGADGGVDSRRVESLSDVLGCLLRKDFFNPAMGDS